MADEAPVDDGDPLPGGDQREALRERGAFRREHVHVEAEGAQIALERRRRDRRPGEDGGRQTDSLPERRRHSAR
jgi:hypothetical protein